MPKPALRIDALNLWSWEQREQIIYTGQLLNDTLKQIVCENTRGLWDSHHMSFVQRQKKNSNKHSINGITRRHTHRHHHQQRHFILFLYRSNLSINSISSSPQHTYGICGRIVFCLKLGCFACFTWKSNWTEKKWLKFSLISKYKT